MVIQNAKLNSASRLSQYRQGMHQVEVAALNDFARYPARKHTLIDALRLPLLKFRIGLKSVDLR